MRHGDARLQLLAPADRVVVGAPVAQAAPESTSWKRLERIGIALGIAASVLTIVQFARNA